MVKAWFKKAIEDYHSAKALCDLKAPGHILNGAYLAQQSIEKSMKGFLTYKNIRFSKTHHLAELVDLLKGVDGVPDYVFSERELLVHLSDWAISGRYPDAVVKTPTPPNHQDIQPALQFALKCFMDLARLSEIHGDTLA